MPGNLLEDAVFLRRERWAHCGGAWVLEEEPLYRGYVFAATRDANQLAKTFAHTASVQAEPAGMIGRAWSPVDDGAMAWLLVAAGKDRVVRSSTAAIVNGELRILEGPLMGQEVRVARVDRHRRLAWVRMGEEPRRGGADVSALDAAATAPAEAFPLHIPFKGTAAEYRAWMAGQARPREVVAV